MCSARAAQEEGVGMSIVLNQRFLGGVLLLGQALDLLGGLYLAYDLFGGVKGPLRRLTEIITYIVAALAVNGSGDLAIFYFLSTYNPRLISTFGFEAALGGVIGLAIGGGVGGGFGYAYNLKYQRQYVPRSEGLRLLYAGIIGLVTGLFGYGFYLLAALLAREHFSFTQALLVGLLYSLVNGYVFASMIARLLVRRIPEAEQDKRPVFDRFGFFTGALVGIIISVIISLGYWLLYNPDPLNAVASGIAAAVVAAAGIGLFVGGVQNIERRILELSAQQRRMGIFGASLVLCGFGLQSLQYFVMIFAVSIH